MTQYEVHNIPTSPDGGGEEDRPQDGLLLRAGGLQNVQRAVARTEPDTFIMNNFIEKSSKIM